MERNIEAMVHLSRKKNMSNAIAVLQRRTKRRPAGLNAHEGISNKKVNSWKVRF